MTLYIYGLSKLKVKNLITPYLNNSIDVKIDARFDEVEVHLNGKDKKELDKIYKNLCHKLGRFYLGKNSLEEAIFSLVKVKGWTLGTAESCTGGLIGAKLTNVPGISEIYQGSFITYANKWKSRYLDVKEEVLRTSGAVCQEVAYAMAKGLEAKKIDCGIAVTGVAGPQTEGDKPIGLVYIGTFIPKNMKVTKYNFSGDREAIRYQAMINGLNQLRLQLID